MTVAAFEYLAPKSIEEACKMIEEHEGKAKVLAGGQSLIPVMKLNLVEVSYLVDLKRIPGMAFIKTEKSDSSRSEEILRVGALTTYSDLSGSEIVRERLPLLADTARGIGHLLVRNRGTIGGSLSHCDPSGDLCVSALALDASMVIARADGSRRSVGAEDFFKGLFATALQRGELLEEIRFPIPRPGTGHDFQKLTLGHRDFPLVSVSVVLRVEGSRCSDVRLAVGGVSDRAIRMKAAEGILKGGPLRTEDIENASASASDASDPSSDLEVSGSYKKRMVKVLVGRALRRSMERRGWPR
jgi:carbon-monoxide dehydrogenase medium subunit